MLRRVLVFTLAFLGTLPRVLVGQESTPTKKRVLVRFCAMGDVPRSELEFKSVQVQIDKLPENSEFTLHLGDIKNGADPCVRDIYKRVAMVFRKSRQPVMFVPGDNEWNDCDDPDAAWNLWTEFFLRFERHWEHGLEIRRQATRPENFAFRRSGVLFIGVNLVGGRVHDKDEWETRQQDDVRWMQKVVDTDAGTATAIVVFAQSMLSPKNEIFFNGLSKLAKEVKRPILYLHGDGHRWISDQPFHERNIFRVQVDAGGKAAPVLISVTNDPKRPFVFDRRIAND